MKKYNFDTKIAIVIEKGLPNWQVVNVTAFLSSAVASNFPDTLGPKFRDASNVEYLEIYRQPVIAFSAKPSKLKKAYNIAREESLDVGIYTRPIFSTQAEDNVKAIASEKEQEQDFVGIIVYGKKEKVDKAVKGLSLFK